jgi:hypothetical protein
MGFRKTRTRTQVKDTTAVTTAYTGFTSDPVDLIAGIRGEFAGFLLTIVKDDATSLEFKLEVGDSDAVAATASHWFSVTKATGAIDERTVTGASLATTDYLAVFQDVNLAPYSKVRLRVKKTGGTGTVNVTAHALYGGQA